jgi:adenine-specific DNA methylase
VKTDPVEEYLRGRVVECFGCEKKRSLADVLTDNMRWDVVLVERVVAGIRALDLPTEHEVAQAESPWQGSVDLGSIPEGKETRVLRRHGFERWVDLYPRRQLAVTSRILEEIEEIPHSDAARDAIKLAVVGTAEMAGYASRWDRWYLKSYELMARHRFSVTTLAVEPHVWGINYLGRGTVQRRLHAFRRASRWLTDNGITAKRVESKVIAHRSSMSGFHGADAVVVQGSSKKMLLPSGWTDLILTDPPYHDDIQYSELSAPLRAWRGFSPDIDSGSVIARSMGQSAQYETLLREVFDECYRILRPGGHMVMSYANRDLAAWAALIGALDKAGFRGCGFAVVHGENESDFAKRKGSHYTHNLLIDVVKNAEVRVGSWVPEGETGPEVASLRAVGEMILRLGALPGDWRGTLTLMGQDGRFEGPPRKFG